MKPNPARFVRLLAVGGITMAAIAVFLLLRPDVGRLVSAQYRRSIGSRFIISKYVRNQSTHKLQIGAGQNNKPGWLNTDIDVGEGQAYLDATQPFPLPEGSFRYVFSEHVIEHLTYDEALNMLRQCHRLIAPGGKIRIATPNLLKFVELFQEAKSDEMRRYESRKIAGHQWPTTLDPECYILNLQMHEWGHRFIYTPKMLRASLEKSGFKDVKEFPVGVSDDPELSGLEARSNGEFRDVNAHETLILQAARE